MKARQFLSQAYSFLLLHRMVVLIVGIIILGSIFSIYMLARGEKIEAPLTSPPRKAPKVTLEPGLPQRTLKAWGVDPFRDVLREMKIEEEKRLEAQRIREQQENEKIAVEEITAAIAKARELAAREEFKTALDGLESAVTKHAGLTVPVLAGARSLLAEIRARRDKALIEARRSRELEEEQARQREHRKNVILSLRIDGVISGKKPSESSAIVGGEPYSVGDTVVKGGVEARIVEIQPTAVVFRDPKSRDTYRVPISR